MLSEAESRMETLSSVVVSPLSEVEQSELSQCEAVIERGLKTFVDVGNALLRIRDGKLYRNTHDTFEDYCRERWSMAQGTAYRMMYAADVVSNLKSSPIGELLPSTESQARPLVRLEPEQQVIAWQLAVETAPNGKITAAHVEQVVKELTHPEPEPELIEPEILPPPPAPQPSMAVHYSSESDEWYTPQHIVRRVCDVLGTVDLDPCSNNSEHPNIPATHHLTASDDGLAHPWFGRVYMNPPYGREISDWISHLCQEWYVGHVTEAIVLVPSRTDTEWFRQLREFPRCFIWGRLKFSDNDNSAPFPSMAVYLGNHPQRFADCFCDVGDVYTLWNL
jgi:hypothetical protein